MILLFYRPDKKRMEKILTQAKEKIDAQSATLPNQ